MLQMNYQCVLFIKQYLCNLLVILELKLVGEAQIETEILLEYVQIAKAYIPHTKNILCVGSVMWQHLKEFI